MKKTLLIGLLCLGAVAQVEAQPVRVATNGPTVVEASSGEMTVQVRIETSEREITIPPEGKPASDHSNCTYSRVPCSLVEHIEIRVNGTPLLIPRSVFADLADLGTINLSVVGNDGRITLHGGDASESYHVLIEFDDRRIKRRQLLDALVPGQVLQETVFHEPTSLE